MNRNYIKDITLQVFEECNIYSFPINCHEILEHYKIKALPYFSLDSDIREYSYKYSDDAYSYKEKVFYNNLMPSGRIKFSLMHELGHRLLEHTMTKHTQQMEREANFFASLVLAPRMAIHYANCKDENEVSKQFNLTLEAASYAYHDYIKWHKLTSHYKMNAFDKAMYTHFYNDQHKGFVYNITTCYRCGEILYNKEDCIPCLIYDSKHQKTPPNPTFRYV